MPITVLPPAVGEAEARRFQALQGVLSAVVDQLAARLEFDCPLDGKERAVHAQHERAEHDKLQAEASRVSAELHGGLKVPRSLGALAAGRLDRIAAAIEQEHRAKSAEQARVAHEKTRIATEDAALALDTALRMVATADATQAARRLADAAEEAASGARQARGEDRDRGMTRLQASLTVLHASTQWITTLDRLGKDLGEVIGIGARRIERSMEADELHNAELAARDLAMRLRNPLPSFSGGGGRRSTEAGGMPQQGEEGEGEGEGESAQMNEQRQEVDRLAKDHGDELKALEEELARAMREGSTQELREQGREHARAVREAVRNLPSMAADSSSAEGAAAMGRESGHAMADALESGKLPEAVARGRNAVRALEQARRLAGQQHDYFGDPFRLSTELEQSKAKLERELRWAEQQLENLRKSMADKAKDAVERGAGAEEKLAQRTADAARKGRAGDGPPMPKAMLDLLDEAEKAMRESSKALKTAEVDKGTDHQREAQRLLEMAREIQGSEEASRDVGDEGDGGKGLSGGAVDIPKAEDFRGPEAFRKRVLEGLSGSGDARLRGAVRRYAEGLLR
jgi:hypothetical protein